MVTAALEKSWIGFLLLEVWDDGVAVLGGRHRQGLQSLDQLVAEVVLHVAGDLLRVVEGAQLVKVELLGLHARVVR